MSSFLGISAVNPALLWGAAAVAAPIIIHLLSKRKFKIIDWAAMDFLFDADKRNRRRVRMENLILLLLRCLAVVLIALLVARPVLTPSGMASTMMKSASVERIVLLDDSPSTLVSAGKGTAFDQAKLALIEFVRDMASERSADTLTLLVTSQPDTPLLNGQFLGADRSQEIVQVIDALKPADVSANLDRALLELEDLLDSPTGNVNRVVYLLNDLRRRDWIADKDTPHDKNVATIVGRVARKAQSFFLVDIGNDSVENLVITGVEPIDKTLVADVEARFQVSVANAGHSDADDVQVKFEPGGLVGRIDHIPAGGAGSAVFTYTFRETGEVQVRAETGADVLAADNVRHFAGHVQDGVRVLLVDGDPSSEPQRSETFYLNRALAPVGNPLGNAVEVVTENQFETLNLSKYQLICLANLYRVTDDRVEALEAWVKGGGGLVLILGDQVDPETYNQRLYREGQGLLPLRLAEIHGDETETRWVNFTIESPNHPVLGIFDGAQSPLLKVVHVFRWWGSTLSESDAAAGRLTVLSRFGDPDNSPALVEKSFGQGRVMAITTALDEDWSDWPAFPTFVMTVQLMNEHLARRTTGEATAVVGMPIRYEIDPSRYKIDVKVKAPGQEPATVQALADAQSRGDLKNLVVTYDTTERSGIYDLELSGRDGKTEHIAFARNLDPEEGELRRVDDGELQRLLGDAPVVVNRGQGVLSLDASGSRAELWKPTLFMLGAVLGIEQVLAWLFGRRR